MENRIETYTVKLLVIWLDVGNLLRKKKGGAFLSVLEKTNIGFYKWTIKV